VRLMSSKKSSKDKELVVFEYQYAPDFKEYYVTGARGGIQNIYHLRLDFYSERIRLRSMEDVLVEDEKGKRVIIPRKAKKGPEVVERNFKIGLNLSFNAVKELANFLNVKVKEIEELEERMNKEGIIEEEG